MKQLKWILIKAYRCFETSPWCPLAINAKDSPPIPDTTKIFPTRFFIHSPVLKDMMAINQYHLCTHADYYVTMSHIIWMLQNVVDMKAI